jgi:hypothetical protein
LKKSYLRIIHKVGGLNMTLDKESLVNLICTHCEFYKESDKDLECGAYKILKGLLEKGVITPEQILDATRG